MSEPIPNKDEQEVLNNLAVALQKYALIGAAFGVLEGRLRSLSCDPVRNPLAPMILEELVRARFAMGGTVGSA